MGYKIVCIGGGTGLPNLLRGLKEYTNEITAIVTVADDGGSSGRLRDEMKILPPGDIRNCLLALADTEPLMEMLFQYRFNSGSLKGHSFGNLFLAAMTEMLGDFELAIKESSKVLAVRGRVLPSTLEDVKLEAEYDDGTVICGESRIPQQSQKISRVRLVPSNAKPLNEAVVAVKEADAVVLGPGSLYTSIIPNLLVKDLTEAILESDAKKIYVVNIMTQPGETTGYSASDHVKSIVEHSDDRIIEHVVVNVENIPSKLLLRYHEEGSICVSCDENAIRKMGYRVVTAELINPSDYVRHSPKKLADTVINILNES
ncbi:MAG: gluconeogenesis factor YvcK family protein [Tepidanaerobacteraceae bacterium]